ncbi:GAGA-binding transcriptional activator [Zostera marina]|uniref:GAGA-binding transcriptional activator n=1 Tax=Zostera marina TaxID=29655 RepID=A0A0K9P6X8_ZOSMR|nr:GAGA-binding transcriptional activator [Zostera marina]
MPVWLSSSDSHSIHRGLQMDDDGVLGISNWGYYDQPSKNNQLGLQLMSGMSLEQQQQRGRKPVLSSNAATFLHCDMTEQQSVRSSTSMEIIREGWLHNREKMIQMFPPTHHNCYTLQFDPAPTTEQSKEIKIEEESGRRRTHQDVPQTVVPLNKKKKKNKQDQPCKIPKVAKSKIVRDEMDGGDSSSVPKVGRSDSSVRKNTEVTINGIDLDISRIPTPVCTCTGVPRPCYRWGVGGWQSACCTTSISMHPLPVSTKRRGSRIAGRKMSHGAFKKVLEKLAGEGYNLSNRIDLRSHWAKHGSNKFVTIR